MNETAKAIEPVDDVLQAMIEAFKVEREVVKSDRFCEWYMKILAEADALDERVDAQYKRIKNEIAARRKGLQIVHGLAFKQRVDAMLAVKENRKKDGSMKKKSVNLLTGTAGYRARPESINFTDIEKAKAWAVENFDSPELFAAVGHISKTQIIVDAIKLLNLPAAISMLNKTPFLNHVKKDGVIPDGVEVRRPPDKFYPQVDGLALPEAVPVEQME